MSNQTYAETQEQEPFNWFLALKSDDIDWDDLRTLSKSWTTCACGNLCSIIPRYESGAPMDPVLALLGGPNGFHGAITSHNREEALTFLEAIEHRSSYLIKIIQNDNKNPT